MGVPYLWECIKEAGESRALGSLAVVEGFEKNPSSRRALRVGIDISLWFHQVTRKHDALNTSELGDNPDLRTLFFRLCTLAQWPILPLFVFDGRERPKVKRGSRVGKSGSHPLSKPMKEMLGHFGMQWCEAAGEAEAELACLNRDGLIDAIITDDCDVLIFGGKTIIRNASLDLSGNKAHPALDANGKASKHHAMVFTAEGVHSSVGLTRGALLLFALLVGGDYDSGVAKVGPATASSLGRCGFGDQLLEAFQRFQRWKDRRAEEEELRAFLVGWRTEINAELRSNSRGHLKQRSSSLVLPADFPDLDVLTNYAAPVVRSEQSRGGIRDTRDMDLAALAGFCEAHFSEWGHRAAIMKRFRTLLWRPAVAHVLRRAALLADEKECKNLMRAGVANPVIKTPLQPPPSEAVGTPAALVRRSLGVVDRAARIASAFVNQGTQDADAAAPETHPLLVQILGTRTHVSTDALEEFRVEVCPHQLVALADEGIKGTRKSGQTAKSAPEPESNVRMWIPAAMMRQVHPALVADFLARRKGKRKARDEESEDESESVTPPAPKRRRRSPSVVVLDTSPAPAKKRRRADLSMDDIIDLTSD